MLPILNVRIRIQTYHFECLKPLPSPKLLFYPNPESIIPCPNCSSIPDPKSRKWFNPVSHPLFPINQTPPVHYRFSSTQRRCRSRAAPKTLGFTVGRRATNDRF